jgi:hypothetical protein
MIERVVVGEFKALNYGLAVDHLAAGHCAALCMAISLLDAEVVRVAERLCAPRRFDRPLGDHQLGWASGLLFEAHGDPRHLIEAGFEVFHKSSVDK